MEGIKYSPVKRKVHPLERGSFFSKVFFCWFPLFLWRGLKREIDEDGIYTIKKSQEAAELGNKLEMAWKKELMKETPSLTKALIKVFGGELALFALFHIFGETVKAAHPILVFYMLSLFQKENSSQNRTEIFIYASATTVCVFLRLAMQHNYQLWIMCLGSKIRVAVCSLIYRKSLKLSRSALADTTVGQMVNLLTNDVGKFDMAVQFLHYLWVTPFLTAAVGYFLYIFVGLCGIVGTVFLIAFVPIQMYMAKLISKYRLRTATKTDVRVRLMNEIISGIQVIKMYTWEKPFSKLVEITRRNEIEQIRVSTTINAIIESLSIVLIKIAAYVSILSHVVTGNTLSATYTYTVLSFYGALKLSLVTFFSRGLTNLAETKVSLQRIQRFLLTDEQPEKASIDDPSHYNEGKSRSEDIGIRIENMSVSWSEHLPENTLQNIHFNAAPHQLVAIVGPVGSGKTTLLNSILGELAPVEGHVEIKGAISYASQEPWLFAGSVRQNIIFGQEYVPKKYEEVIKVCALQNDFSRFPHGDKTLVGERGVTLSGGQRARINLARAVYKEADIYLLDDPLSAVDTHVGKQLFDECICGYLRDKCVVLVSHQLQYLMNAQCIYLLEDGRVHSSGTYEELKTSDSDFTKLLNESKEVNDFNDIPTGIEVEKKGKIENEESPMIQQKEQRASGKIKWIVYRSYFKAVGSLCKIFAVLVAFIMGQVAESAGDYFLSIWVNLEQWRKQHGNETNSPEHRSMNLLSNTSMPPSTSRRISLEFLTRLNPILTGYTPIIIYSFLILLTVTVVVSSRIAFSRCCMAASTSLHNSMFNKIVLSSMRFFNTNPSGRILNRFSKDVGLVDENLPTTFSDSLSIGCMVIAVVIVVGSLNPWILIPTLIIGMIFYFMRKAYLVSSRNIKRLEAITRSPVYTHLTASIQGLTTIRAFGAEKILTKEFDSFQDSYTAAYFMFLTAARGFGFWLDLHCSIYTFLVMISILFIQNDSYGGNVGLSLTQAISLSGLFQYAMRQWSEFENQMTSVERIQEYADLTPEGDTNTRDPPKSWPYQGSIKFVNLSMRYFENTPYILKNLNFEIGPREKIGIVGRTGAGKSSLIQALFRLADTEGSILINGVDTKSVPLKVLRSKISIIPQEPVLFSGTLRMNLDPFDEYNDEILWDALEQVELKNAVNELSDGLGSKVIEGGSNFSVGQRQLICLARAIVRNNKILVLDEATANVDPQTDALIQSTIRKKFAHCTVLTIAHRLHTIMDSDRVLVMDDGEVGEVVEFDHPLFLLQMKEGVFQRLVKQTGISMADNLYSIAEDSFSRRDRTTSS